MADRQRALHLTARGEQGFEQCYIVPVPGRLELVGLGARCKERIKEWTVMQDHEGYEYCVVQIPARDPVELWLAGAIQLRGSVSR